jgi:regulator of protease activity HflC (stomatin/prohibitin superfamily)
MNKFIGIIGLVAISACAKVEPGYVGIVVNQYGSQKGVSDFPIQTGRVWYNLFTEDVYLFPTFRQNVVWTRSLHEGSENDDSVTFNSIEGAVINADIALSYSLEAEKAPLAFVTFRKDIEHITHIYIRSEARDAISRHASTMKVIDIFGAKKQALLEAVKQDLNDNLGKVGFQFEMVSFIGGLRCDDKVMGSINATIEATQKAVEAQNKIVQATAEAEQAIATSNGEAQSILNVAKAQADANHMITASLTPELIKYKAIEKWNGTAPTVMGSGFETLINIPK